MEDITKYARNSREMDELFGDINFRLRNTPYKVIDGCLYREFEKAGELQRQYLANFYIVPLAEIYIHLDGYTYTFFRLQAVHEGKELEIVNVSSNAYTSMNFIYEAWEIGLRMEVGINAKSHIKRVVSEQTDFVQKETFHIHTYDAPQKRRHRCVRFISDYTLQELGFEIGGNDGTID